MTCRLVVLAALILCAGCVSTTSARKQAALPDLNCIHSTPKGDALRKQGACLPEPYRECLAPGLAVAPAEREAFIKRCSAFPEMAYRDAAVSEGAKQALARTMDRDGRIFLQIPPPADKPAAPPRPPAPRDATPEEAMAWSACAAGKIREIDDGVSPPKKVAVVVARACRQHFKGSEGEDIAITTEAILLIREKQHGDPVVFDTKPLPRTEMRF